MRWSWSITWGARNKRNKRSKHTRKVTVKVLLLVLLHRPGAVRWCSRLRWQMLWANWWWRCKPRRRCKVRIPWRCTKLWPKQ